MKKNNLFKINLLLLVLNSTIIKPDELSACRDGVKNRNGQNGVPLITDYSQIPTGAPNQKLDTIRLKAAWIFGYNSNHGSPYPFADGKSLIAGNNCVDGAGDSGDAYCIEGIDVCDYGSSIGWALNDDGSNTLNFYRDYGAHSRWTDPQVNYLLYYLWGRRFGSNSPSWGVRNNLEQILSDYINQRFSNQTFYL